MSASSVLRTSIGACMGALYSEEWDYSHLSWGDSTGRKKKGTESTPSDYALGDSFSLRRDTHSLVVKTAGSEPEATLILPGCVTLGNYLTSLRPFPHI